MIDLGQLIGITKVNYSYIDQNKIILKYIILFYLDLLSIFMDFKYMKTYIKNEKREDKG